MIELLLWIAAFVIVGLCCLSYSLATWKDYWKQATENTIKEKDYWKQELKNYECMGESIKREKKIVPKKGETLDDFLRRQS